MQRIYEKKANSRETLVFYYYMKKTVRIIGLFTIFVGVFLGIFQVINTFSDTAARGTITNILERKTGTVYSSVQAGSVSPCKLEITYKDKNGQEQVGQTSYEISPCSKYVIRYFRVGDEVNIDYSEDKPTNVAVSGLFERLGFLLLIPVFGLGLLYVSSRAH